MDPKANSAAPRLVLRYRPAQRLVHWIGVATFLSLLVSGCALIVPPAWFVAAGPATRWIHRAGAVVFLALPVAYAVAMPRRAWELLVECLSYSHDDRAWLRALPGYLLGRTRGLPPQGRLNAGQKLHHLGTFAMFVTVSGSGLLLWLAKGHLGPTGLALAASVHDLSMLGLVVLLAGHVYFTFLYGAFSGMRTGWVREEYARMEHGRWLESLPPEAFRGPGARSERRSG